MTNRLTKHLRSLSTWRLLHVKAVNAVVEGGISRVGADAEPGHLKRRVLDFLGLVPSGIKLMINYLFYETVIVDAGSGVTETTWNTMGLITAAAWNPSGTKLAQVSLAVNEFLADEATTGVLQISDAATGKTEVFLKHGSEAEVELGAERRRV